MQETSGDLCNLKDRRKAQGPISCLTAAACRAAGVGCTASRRPPLMARCRFCCRFEDTEDLQVSSPTSALQPGEACDVAITFTPQQARTYSETVPVNINGLYVVNVLIVGEAAPLRLSCANPAHQNLHLGSVSKGAQASKTVQVRLHTAGCHSVLQTCISCQAPSSLEHESEEWSSVWPAGTAAMVPCYHAQLQRVRSGSHDPNAEEESACRW